MAHEHAGQSLLDMLWEQADKQYAKLKDLHAKTGGVTAETLLDVDTSNMVGYVEYLQTQGKVQALCFTVGTVLFPYESAKDRIEKVRPLLAERWEAAQEEEEEDEGDE